MEPKKITAVFQIKPVGKVRRRLQSMRYRSLLETTATLDLSHNESARLATDALLDGGLDAYKEVLTKDGEVDFLSREEKKYILGNISGTTFNNSKDDEENSHGSEATDSDSDQTYFPSATDSQTLELDHGWPAEECYHLKGMPTVDVHFQTSGSSMKDMLRQFISKATTVLAIVMDTFSDIEIFCDILEAMQKRNVSVYLLLDHQHLPIFLEMCNNLQINGSHLPRMSVRSVPGETYCAKSGKKFTGQIQERFIIADCTEVLVGSYSFTWLSWRVHRSLAMVFKDSGVKPFDVEFRRLYAASLPVKELTVAGNTKSLPSYLSTNTQPSTISSSASTVTEIDVAVGQHIAEPKQNNGDTDLKDPRLPSPTGLLISTTGQPRYQIALPDQGKVLPSGPLVGPGTRHQLSPGPSPSLLPPRLQWLLIQRHSSFPKDHGVSALPWRPVVTANNNNHHHHHHILAGVPQTARWALIQK